LGNVITGTSGDNVLDGGVGADTMIGGAGSDTYHVDNAGDVVVENAGGGTDTVIATIDYALGSTAVENLTLAGSAHLGTGNAGDNVITGGGGNDTLDGGGGLDTLVGGTGDDRYMIRSASDSVVEAAGGGSDTEVAGIDVALAANVENLELSGDGTIGTGNALDNTLTGSAGRQTLIGGDGNDVLDGSAGADIMIGGAGDDTYFVDNPGDVVVEDAGGGTDTVVSTSDVFSIPANIENIRLTGSARTAIGNAADNRLSGGSGNDTLDGGDGNDLELGGDGNDTLISRSGIDTLSGGSGDDIYKIAGGSAAIEDFLGHDTIDASEATGDSYIDLSGATDSIVEHETTHLGTGGTTASPLDVQFLQDLTGSFGDDIATVRGLVPQIVTALRAVQVDSHFGVTSFVDKPVSPFGAPGEWVYNLELGLTADVGALTSTYNGLAIRYGADEPEAQIENLMQVALHAVETGFRLDSARFAILFTDAPYHKAGDGAAGGITTPNNGDNQTPGSGALEDYPFVQQVKSALEAANIIPVFAIANSYESVYQGLVAELGRGTVVSLSPDSSNIVTAITAGLTAATTTHIEDAIGGAGNDTLKGGVEANHLRGGDGSDTIEGGIGNDTLDGEGGNDTLVGGAGDDALLGGAGIDTAVYSGTRADYLITALSATSATVQDLRATGGEGTDTVTDVEYLRFSDATVALGAPPANQAPAGATLATATVAENSLAGTVVGTVVGSDPDAQDTLTYSLVDDAGGRFAIDAASGALTVAGGAAIDFETATSHAIAVRVTDLAGAFGDFNFSISVANVNDLAPAFSSPAAFSMAENGTGAGTVVATDPDGLAAVSYSITGGADAARFSVDGATGALSFVVAPNFELPSDANRDNVYDVVVTASDGGLATAQPIAVAVTDVVEVPTMTYVGTALADTFVVADANGWTISGLAGDDSLTGGALADVLVGGRGNDFLAGGGGDDVFKVAVRDGSDSFDGGAGFDRIVATTANAAIGIAALSGIETIASGGFANVSIVGTAAADTLDFSGMALAGIVEIDAGAGNDTVVGSSGDDRFVLGSGSDSFSGGAGNDTFLARGKGGTDSIDGGAGYDQILVSADNVAIGISVMSGIEAIDAGAHVNASLLGTSAGETLDMSGIVVAGALLIDAGSGNDAIIGSAGNDVLDLGAGNDSFDGGFGDDMFLAKSGMGIDSVDGGTGYDTIAAAAANTLIALSSFSSIEEISGGGFGGTRLSGTAGNDVIDLSGTLLTSIDSIEGAAGSDVIVGSAGADRILGGAGMDMLTGGAGADIFAFLKTAESGAGVLRADHIADFVPGQDLVDLSALDADTSVAGDQAFTFIGDSAFTGLGQLRLGLDAGGHTAVFGNTTGNLKPDFQISFDSDPVIAVSSFVL
jgi:Ca2+-binding RTX toxin-like protein